ncbi:hypothetical protein GCM10022409_06700 [Hymenobacter glaciei]|uniref:Outer membrane protein beta-barrel domain-containing protein n=1 Tax=Hymenobacter glaciei TaxID=877209 RepID=A0ABP7TF00_9BACT
MRTFFSIMLASATVAAVPTVATAQTRKPAPKPAVRTTTKPAAKPAAKPAVAATPKATAPAPAPAPTPAPAPAAQVASSSGDIPFDVGTSVVNIGIGLGNRYGYGSGLLGGNSSVSPALSISYERGILPLGPGVLGVGAFVGYQGASYDMGGGDKWKYTDLVVTLRGAFHYPVLPNLDAYGGLSLGMRHLGTSFSGPSSSFYNAAGIDGSYNEASLNLFVGGRYYFTPSIGAFAELGYDQTYLKAGLAVKF